MTMETLYRDKGKTLIGEVTFKADDIIRFARDYDPQPFHLDAEAAKSSLLGGLCASGWHTVAGWMKCFVPYWIREMKRLGREGVDAPKLGPSPGFRNLHWLKPVYAGDTIRYYTTFLESKELASRPGWRINTILNEGENQKGEAVIRFESKVIEFP